MRDIIITVLILGAVPWALMRPHVGVLMYAWLSLMNPHRLTYGFAYSFPFGTIVAIATLISMVFAKDRKRVPWSPILTVWLIFVVWLNVSTLFSLQPDVAVVEWDRTMKIQLMIFVTMLVIHNKERINAFVWVIVVSLGFFGVKGGIFTILTGGQYRVMGPWDSFITENNTLALALIMTLPLMRYLMMTATNKMVKNGLLAALVLTTMSIISSFSRGAFIAGGMILLFLIIKSRHRLRFTLAAAVILPFMVMFMPDSWFNRMESIGDYQQDASAMGRINAWWFAFNLAKDHPITGGGFGAFAPKYFLQYAPSPLDFHDAHSIYFEILGEQGFVGLALFLILGYLGLRSCAWIIRSARERGSLRWAGDLAAMLQVSLIGYATGGAFLGLAYYDLYYDLIAVIIVLRSYVKEQLALPEPAEEGAEAESQTSGDRLQTPGRAAARRSHPAGSG